MAVFRVEVRGLAGEKVWGRFATGRSMGRFETGPTPPFFSGMALIGRRVDSGDEGKRIASKASMQRGTNRGECMSERSLTIRIAIATVVVLGILGAFLFLAPKPPPVAKDPAKERQQLMGRLRAGQPEVRAAAAAQLGRHRSVARETVAALAFALPDPDLVVQVTLPRARGDRPRSHRSSRMGRAGRRPCHQRARRQRQDCPAARGVPQPHRQPASPPFPLQSYIKFKGLKQRIIAINALIKLDPSTPRSFFPAWPVCFTKRTCNARRRARPAGSARRQGETGVPC